MTLNPAAASTEGPAPAAWSLVARCAAAAVRLGAGDAAGEAADGCGPTSVPAGETLPSTLKPQFSSCLAASISVSAGQWSRVTTSVWPPRLAIPTYVAPAVLVQPILPPRAPGYVASSEFWFARPTDFFLLILNCALVTSSYFMNDGIVIACRPNSARSYAEVCWPEASSPLGVTATVSPACRCLASALITAMPWA